MMLIILLFSFFIIFDIKNNIIPFVPIKISSKFFGLCLHKILLLFNLTNLFLSKKKKKQNFTSLFEYKCNRHTQIMILLIKMKRKLIKKSIINLSYFIYIMKLHTSYTKFPFL